MHPNAKFIVSNSHVEKCPEEDRPEFAFIGRSNVGKSSLINMLADNKKLAKISGRPGKTQLINHFIFFDEWYLVDLPGYGYAKVSKAIKEQWGPMIQNYLTGRKNLYCVFVLIDSRLPPQKIDIDFLNWLGENELPIALVFTKTDKQSANKTASSVAAFSKAMKATWEEMPPYFLSSAETKNGREEIFEFINEICASVK